MPRGESPPASERQTPICKMQRLSAAPPALQGYRGVGPSRGHGSTWQGWRRKQALIPQRDSGGRGRGRPGVACWPGPWLTGRAGQVSPLYLGLGFLLQEMERLTVHTTQETKQTRNHYTNHSTKNTLKKKKKKSRPFPQASEPRGQGHSPAPGATEAWPAIHWPRTGLLYLHGSGRLTKSAR